MIQGTPIWCLFFIMLFIATTNVVGCVLIKKRGIQIFLGIAAWTGFLLRWRAAYFFTTSITKQPISTYRNLPMVPTNCTSSKSENQIGPSVQPTPVLFSKAMGKPSQRAASTLPTTAKTFGPENWETTWGSDHASATIFGEEQSDYRYNLSLDGGN